MLHGGYNEMSGSDDCERICFWVGLCEKDAVGRTRRGQKKSG